MEFFVDGIEKRPQISRKFANNGHPCSIFIGGEKRTAGFPLPWWQFANLFAKMAYLAASPLTWICRSVPPERSTRPPPPTIDKVLRCRKKNHRYRILQTFREKVCRCEATWRGPLSRSRPLKT